MKRKLKDLSRADLVIDQQDVDVPYEQIIASALIRIADASELTAKNFLALQKEAEYYKDAYRRELARGEQKTRTITNMKGQITKLKNKR